jgi:hypothetical protein
MACSGDRRRLLAETKRGRARQDRLLVDRGSRRASLSQLLGALRAAAPAANVNLDPGSREVVPVHSLSEGPGETTPNDGGPYPAMLRRSDECGRF